jgi:hypothetical protein
MSNEGSPVEIVYRNNNVLESYIPRTAGWSYNCRFNALFLKQPSLIEFAMIIEKESREQARHRKKARTRKERHLDPYYTRVLHPVQGGVLTWRNPVRVASPHRIKSFLCQ